MEVHTLILEPHLNTNIIIKVQQTIVRRSSYKIYQDRSETKQAAKWTFFLSDDTLLTMIMTMTMMVITKVHDEHLH